MALLISSCSYTQWGQQLRQSSVTLKNQRWLSQYLTNSSKDKRLDLLKSSVVCICYRVCSEGCHFKDYICTLYNNTDLHQQIPLMRSTDWLSHHRLAIYRYEYLGTNVPRIRTYLLPSCCCLHSPSVSIRVIIYDKSVHNQMFDISQDRGVPYTTLQWK